jgi:hypothetical protein
VEGCLAGTTTGATIVTGGYGAITGLVKVQPIGGDTMNFYGTALLHVVMWLWFLISPPNPKAHPVEVGAVKRYLVTDAGVQEYK